MSDSLKFYVISKSPKLKGPAIFCSSKDALPFLDFSLVGLGQYEYMTFDFFPEAADYLQGKLPRERTSSKKRKLAETQNAPADAVTNAAKSSANPPPPPPKKPSPSSATSPSLSSPPPKENPPKCSKTLARCLADFDRQTANLEKFKAEYGDTDVPYKKAVFKNYKGKVLELDTEKYHGLGYWCSIIRKELKIYNISPPASQLTVQQAKKLKHLDFCLEPRRGVGVNVKPVWNDVRYKELLDFRDNHQHVSVPYKPQTALRKWLDLVLQGYRDMKEGLSCTLTDEQIKMMDDINFDWTEKQLYTFEESARRWLAYRNEHGEDPHHSTRLGEWVSKQRGAYKVYNNPEIAAPGNRIRLKESQIEMLNNWGFDWKEDELNRYIFRPKPKTFDERLAELVHYKLEHGDTLVPQIYPGLGNWVKNMRKDYKDWKVPGKKSAMTQERYQKLVDVGFVFEDQAKGPRFNRAKVGEAPHPLQTKALLKSKKKYIENEGRVENVIGGGDDDDESSGSL